MSFHINELSRKYLWKSYFWKGDVQHEEHFEQNSKILSLFIPRESISLQILFTFSENFSVYALGLKTKWRQILFWKFPGVI